jgi:hypothetical protein
VGLEDLVPDAEKVTSQARPVLRGDRAAKPAKLARKDRNARWTLKRAKVRRSKVEIAIPLFECKNVVSIARAHGFVRAFPSPMRPRTTGAAGQQ